MIAKHWLTQILKKMFNGKDLCGIKHTHVPGVV